MPNSRAVVTLFGGEWLLWVLMMFHYKSMVSHHMNIVMFISGECYGGSSEMSQIHVQWSHFLTAIGNVDFDDVSLQKYGQLII